MISSLLWTAIRIYAYVILARIVVSWLQLDPYHPVVQYLYKVTEPALRPARQLIPPVGGIDFSPIIVFTVLQVVGEFLVRLLFRVGL